MGKKRDLTVAEWVQTGIDLMRAKDLIWGVVQKLQTTMPVQVADNLMRAERQIDRIRARLEDELERQHPEMRASVIAVFQGRYPSPPPGTQSWRDELERECQDPRLDPVKETVMAALRAAPPNGITVGEIHERIIAVHGNVALIDIARALEGIRRGNLAYSFTHPSLGRPAVERYFVSGKRIPAEALET
jgi:hypothetical protein